MAKPSSAFVRHLSFFTSPPHPHVITLMSALKSTLSLGLNFPVSLVVSISLRLLYSPTPLIPIRPPNTHELSASQNRTMLESALLPASQDSFSRDDLMALVPADERSWINRGHIWGLWALAADNITGRVSYGDVQRIQDGSLLESVKQRRRLGRSSDNVLPFTRGGPGNVAGHSWVVGKLFGVSVYRREDEKKSL